MDSDISNAEEDLDVDDRPLERLLPLGADDSDDEYQIHEFLDYDESSETDLQRLQALEIEQEQLTGSLLALTTHFAQVQFRLQQIVSAPPDKKEILLRELEQFAFKGIPDIRYYQRPSITLGTDDQEENHENKLLIQRERQKELIGQLKSQLEELEQFAYETGDSTVPQKVIVEKQRVIIDQLKNKLSLKVDDLDKVTPDDLRNQVDSAISQLVNPLKMKEQLVTQLKTQVTDLERFIEYLQGENGSSLGPCECSCSCPIHGRKDPVGAISQFASNSTGKHFHGKHGNLERDEVKERAHRVVKRAMVLLQMITTVSQLGCGGSAHFQRNNMKMTPKGNHWGDLRAKFEVSLNKVLELATCQQAFISGYDDTDDSEDSEKDAVNRKLLLLVRKEFSPALRDLMQHGLYNTKRSTSLVPFLSCGPERSNAVPHMLHAWDVILEYYRFKEGDQFNSTPARKLSQSFNLDIVGGIAITTKQQMLGAIGDITTNLTPLKRSPDSHFKAFIFKALNAKKLSPWLRLVYRSRHIVDNFYHPWSYVRKTGFDDTFVALERLQHHEFDLPEDFGTRQLNSIEDVF